MIANIQAQPIRKLCTLAQNDESALQYPLPDEIFGFHAQQSYDYRPALSDSERKDMKETVRLLRDHVIERILQLERGVKP